MTWLILSIHSENKWSKIFKIVAVNPLALSNAPLFNLRSTVWTTVWVKILQEVLKMIKELLLWNNYTFWEQKLNALICIRFTVVNSNTARKEELKLWKSVMTLNNGKWFNSINVCVLAKNIELTIMGRQNKSLSDIFIYISSDKYLKR